MLVHSAELVECDHHAFLRCVGKALDCHLWATVNSMLTSPQAAHVRRYGTADVLQKLEALQARVTGADRDAHARGKLLQDEPIPGHPITKYLELLYSKLPFD